MRAYERFLNYIKINTNSDESSGANPSSPNQFVLAEMLVKEMQAMGIGDAYVDEHCYVYGSIAQKGEGNWPVIGLIAHMDTSPSVPGGPINANIIDYTGGDIKLCEGLYIKPSENSFLDNQIGKRLIVTDGSTLLGADDKAGIAEILTLCEALLKSDGPNHGKICIAFTPDEEIGQGADHFDVKKFGADFAYTVDGGALGELEWETFNAAAAKILFHGVNIHPGSAKNKMRNACLMALDFMNMVPSHESPAHTEGYEGFYHLTNVQGNEEACEINYIIRDHDRQKFEAKKERITHITNYLENIYGPGSIELILKDSYYNMSEIIKNHMDIVYRAQRAFESCGVVPIVAPIRGGTDGARLSFMGLPCPNLSTGGYNFHSRKECIPIEDMDKMVEVLLALITQ